MAEVTPKWTEEELSSDAVSKKDLVVYLQETGSIKFQQEQKVKGQVKSIAKTKSKDVLIAAYKVLFETKDFKKEGEDEEFAQAEAAKKADKDLAEAAANKLEIKDKGDGEAESGEAPKFTKNIIKKGNKLNYPLRGDTVTVYYTGKLANGTVFDTNNVKGKKGQNKNQPLKVKVGKGQLIKGWDEALLTMSYGELAEIIIEPAWGYGRRGIEGKIPPNATLHFEVELCTIE